MNRRRSWSLPLLLAVSLGAAACGTSPDLSLGPTDVDVVALVDATPTPAASEPAPTATPSPTVESELAPTSPTATPEAEFRIDLDLSERLPDGWNPLAGLEQDELTPSGDPPVGGSLPAPGNQENRWKYVGVLGKLKPKERVVAPVADPPVAVKGAAVLTGLPGRSPKRPALIVKIDNVAPARPQTGINQADIIYEELVEAGQTRLAAVFHSKAPGTIGPVRSGRSTDIGIIDSFNKPIFAFSGANSIYDRLIDKQPIFNRGAEVYTGYWRSGSRSAPHNLYTSAETMLSSVSGGSAPPAHFAYRADGDSLHETAQPASSVRLTYLAGSSPAIEFRWHEGDAGWRRWQSGTAHVDASGVQLAPANLIVQFVSYIDTGMTDKFGEVLYEGVTVGAGRALVFTDGHVIEATWTRPSLRSVATFTDGSGNHIRLTPGQTFVALVPAGGAAWS